MIRPGMVSVTFRRLTADHIVRLSAGAGLAAIEWGGDIHVPPGDLARARHVSALTRAAGLQVAGYASYYSAGGSDEDGAEFATVLATALELVAPVIRVWAGKIPSLQATAAQRQRTADDLCRIASLAEQAGIRVALEFHAGTLTDSADSTAALLGSEAAHSNLRTHWQPALGENVTAALRDLRILQPWLESIHVFHWTHEPVRRLPLAEGEDCWRPYLKAAEKARYALLEFVAGDDPRNFQHDAATLNRLLGLSALTDSDH